MGERILDGVRIVDLCRDHAGAFATRLLAEAGAEVVKVEPPDGDPARRVAPASFALWNRSKRGVVLDLDDGADRARLDELIAAADVVVHDLAPAAAAGYGLDPAAMASAHPHVIVADVIGFPHDHPDASFPPDDLLVQARVGTLAEIDPLRRVGPAFVGMPVGALHAAYLAAAGILARLDLLARTGAVGPVRTSLAQGLWANLTMLWNRAERPTPMHGPGLLRASTWTTGRLCGDGEWIVQGGADIPAMRESLAALEPPGMLDDPEDVARALLTRPASEWVRHFGEAEQQAMEVLRPGMCLQHPQVVANGFAVEIDDPVLGPTVQAGPPIGTEPPCHPSGPAPAFDPGAEVSFHSPTRAPRGAAAGDRRYPLAGLRVLDLGMFLAGPFGPQCLADLGAEVIKVEPPTGDRMRRSVQMFVGCQRNKRSIALDLADPASRPVLERLVRWADVVHHNLRRPAAAKLGVDAESIRAIKSDVVFCHVSTYGPAGEMADWPGVDFSGHAASGWMWDGAGEGNPPLWLPWGAMDYQCALASLVATLLGVYRHTTTGEGSVVTASLLGAGVTSIDRVLLADDSVSDKPRLDGDLHGRTVERRLYECADGWVAVAADRNGSGQALREVAAADDPAAGFVGRSVADVTSQLDAAGVPNAVVATDQREPFFDDLELRRLRYTVDYEHPEWGRFEQPGAYWSFGDIDVRLDSAPPGLGQHSNDILVELGFARREADELIAAGVVVAP